MNYQLEMENIINNLSTRPKLLLHACCGVCSSYVLEYLNEYFDITVLFYNPNIYPKTEYYKRLNTQKEIIDKLKFNVKLLEIGYNHEEFLKISKGYEEEVEGGKRCEECFYMRLEKTANIASIKNYDYFCTTLSVSPFKNSEKLNAIGKALEEKYNVKYLYSDFKKKNGYLRSLELSKKYNLYRQDYCGCEFSLKTLSKI